MKNYRWDAQDYEQHSRAQQRWARELIDKLGLRGDEDVLDLGCGDGKVSAEIAHLLDRGSVVGVDSSPQMVALAAKRYPPADYTNLSFQVMDARRLSFEACFDLMFSNAALHWVTDHQPVVQGLYRCLRPGGRILLQMGGQGNAEHILSVLAQVQAEPRWLPYFQDFAFPYGFLGIAEYQALLTEAGFTPLRVELIPKDMEHDGSDGLQGWIRTTWLPYTERVPQEKRDAFIAAITARYLEQVPLDAAGKAHVAMVRIEVEAVKTENLGSE
jgi:trans-aconitate methyltransferase